MEKALLNMVLGIGIVFSVLIIISILIACFQIFPYLEDKFKNKHKVEKGDELENFNSCLMGENTIQPIDYTLIAVISAAIAAQENCSINEFVIKSMKRRN